jgi:RNA polymerase sigma factor for flagellar operon FliA
VPSEPDQPDRAFEKSEVRERVRAAIASLPPRERRVIALYYYGEVTMKQIGAEIGVNESRVSQLHARAIRRLRQALSPDMVPADAVKAIRSAVLTFQQKPKMLKAQMPAKPDAASAVVVPYSRTQRPAVAANNRVGGRPRPQVPARARQKVAIGR